MTPASGNHLETEECCSDDDAGAAHATRGSPVSSSDLSCPEESDGDALIREACSMLARLTCPAAAASADGSGAPAWRDFEAPLLLLMLILDDETLCSQVPMGSAIVDALAPLNVGSAENASRRELLVRRARGMLLADSSKFWDELQSSRSAGAMKMFQTVQRGKKAEVMQVRDTPALFAEACSDAKHSCPVVCAGL